MSNSLKLNLLVDDKGSIKLRAFGKEAQKAMAAAQAGTHGFDQSLQKTQKSVRQFDRNTMEMTGRILAAAPAFAIATAAITGVYGAFRLLNTEIKNGFKFVEQYNMNVIQMSALMASFSKKGFEGDIAGAWQEANIYSKQLVKDLEIIDARSAASGKNIIDMTRTMMSFGVQIETQTQKQKDTLVALANAIQTLAGNAPNADYQFIQETRALMEGTSKKGALLIEFFKRQGVDMKEFVKDVQNGTIEFTEMLKYLEAFNAATKDLEKTWTVVGSTLTTIHTRILRDGFGGAYADLIGWATEFRDLLQDPDTGELTAVAVEISQRTADTLEDLKEIAKTVKDISPSKETIVAYGKIAGLIVGMKIAMWAFTAAVKANPIVKLAAATIVLIEAYERLPDRFKEVGEEGEKAWTLMGSVLENTFPPKTEAKIHKSLTAIVDRFKGLTTVLEEDDEVFMHLWMSVEDLGEAAKTTAPEMANLGAEIAGAVEPTKNLEAVLAKLHLATLPEGEKAIQRIKDKYAGLSAQVAELASKGEITGQQSYEMMKAYGDRMQEELGGLTKENKKTATEITKTWDHAFDNMQDVLADFFRTGKFQLDDFADYFLDTLSQMGAAWVMSGLRGGFTGEQMGTQGGMIATGAPLSYGSDSSAIITGLSLLNEFKNPGSYMGAMGGAQTWMGNSLYNAGAESAGSWIGGMNPTNFAAGLSGILSFAGGLMSGQDWDQAATQGVGSAAGTYIGSAWGAPGAIAGGFIGSFLDDGLKAIFGEDFFGGTKRSYLDTTHVYDYTPGAGFNQVWEYETREKREGEQFRSSDDALSDFLLTGMNTISSGFSDMFADMGGTYSTDWENYLMGFGGVAAGTREGQWGGASGGSPDAWRANGSNIILGSYISADREVEYTRSMTHISDSIMNQILTPLARAGTEMLSEGLTESFKDFDMSVFSEDAVAEYQDAFKNTIDVILIDPLGDVEAELKEIDIGLAGVSYLFETLTLINGIVESINMAATGGGLSDYGNAMKALEGEYDDMEDVLISLGVNVKSTNLALAETNDRIALTTEFFGPALDSIVASFADISDLSLVDDWWGSYLEAIGLTRSFDGTVEGLEAMADALGNFSDATDSLVNYLKSAIADIDDMFLDSIETIRLDTMTDQEKYDYYRTTAEDLQASIAAATDPEVIQELTTQLNSATMDAWGLLNETQQVEFADWFTTFLTNAQTISTDTLNNLLTRVEMLDTRTENTVSYFLENTIPSLEIFVADFGEASTRIERAADTFLEAAGGDDNDGFPGIISSIVDEVSAI